MGTLHKTKFSRFLILALIFGGLLSVLTYVLIRTESNIEDSTTLRGENVESILNSKGDLTENFLTESSLIPSSDLNVSDNSSDPGNQNIANIQTVTPFETSDRSMGAGAVQTNRYEFLSAGTYKIVKSDNLFSSQAFMWENGSISVGNSIDQLQILHPTTDEYATDHRFMSELIYSLDKEFFIQVTEPTVVVVDMMNTATVSSQYSQQEIINKDSGAKYSSLHIISRDNWGASTSTWDPYSHTDIDDPARFTWDPGYYRVSKIVIHHTASPNTADDPARAVRDIYLYHAYSRGWGDIGYQYLIDSWGNIYEGKAGGDEVYGYHAYTQANMMGLAISLIGNFENELPTAAQKESLAKLIAEKSLFYEFGIQSSNGSEASWLAQNVTVYGHKDTWFWCYSGHPLDYLCATGDKWVRNNTACPGTNLHGVIASEIVPRAKILASSGFTDIKNAVTETNNALSGTNANIQEFLVTYDLPLNVSKSTIEAKIPSHSGIESYNIYQNRVTIKVGDWNSGVIVPPVGWAGSPTGTYFPASGGPKDRIETLMKIFYLDPDVKSVGVMNRYTISPIE